MERVRDRFTAPPLPTAPPSPDQDPSSFRIQLLGIGQASAQDHQAAMLSRFDMIRAQWSWSAPAAVASALLLTLGVAGCGTNDEKEECFQLEGDLAQVTSDTLYAADHFDAVLSPSGDVVLFTTDYWVEELANFKDAGQRDLGWIEVPAPGEVRTPVPSIHLNGNAKFVAIDDLPRDDLSQSFGVLNKNKGELSWHPDGQQFFATIENDRIRDRIYWLSLVPGAAGTSIRASLVRLIDDVNLRQLSEQENFYYYRAPAVSPNGRWLAYTRYFFQAGDQAAGIVERSVLPAIYAYDLTSDPANPVVVRVTTGSSVETDASWSPDGNWIAFTSNRGIVGTDEVFKVRFDPANPAVEGQPDGRIQLTFSTPANELKLPAESFDPVWMRNGRIVFTSTRRPPCTSERRRNLWSMDAGGGDVRLIVYSRQDDHFAGGANFDTNTSTADNTVVFSARRNPVAAYEGQKDDLYVLRGGF